MKLIMSMDQAMTFVNLLDDLAKARAEWAVANNSLSKGDYWHVSTDETEILKAQRALAEFFTGQGT